MKIPKVVNYVFQAFRKEGHHELFGTVSNLTNTLSWDLETCSEVVRYYAEEVVGYMVFNHSGKQIAGLVKFIFCIFKFQHVFTIAFDK